MYLSRIRGFAALAVVAASAVLDTSEGGATHRLCYGWWVAVVDASTGCAIPRLYIYKYAYTHEVNTNTYACAQAQAHLKNAGVKA